MVLIKVVILIIIFKNKLRNYFNFMLKKIFLFIYTIFIFHVSFSQTKFINNESYKLVGDDNKEILKGNVNLVIENKKDTIESTIDSIYFDKVGNIIRNIRLSNKNGVIKNLVQYNTENLIEKNYSIFNNRINILDSLYYNNNNIAKYYLLINGLYNYKTERIQKYNDKGFLLEDEIIENDVLYIKKIWSYNISNTIKTIQYYDGNTNKLTTEEYFYTKNILDSFIVKEDKILTTKYYYKFDTLNNIIGHSSINYNKKGKVVKKVIFTFKHQLDKKGNWIKREQIVNRKIVATRTRQIIYWN